ncbi:MAG: AAA family ATPase, partial [Pseudomonadota bacterium]
MIRDSQTDVIDFLSSPNAHRGRSVQQIDTHLSHIFLTSDRAYKLKRAVRYAFADFSKASLRKTACEKEAAINRRTAPELYLGVLPIYCNDGVMSWSGDGAPVDWVVEMVRFDTDFQFDRLAARDRIEPNTVKRLADIVADFHMSAAVVRGFKSAGGAEEILDQISTALHGHEINARRAQDIARWSALALNELEKHSKFMEARRRRGWVRHCHGDLHLANICLHNGRPTPFDAIEFNDDLANIDVLYDLAFTLMDLARHNLDASANILLNRYLATTRDYAGLRLLPLFQSMRAAVRAMVLSLPTQADRHRSDAERYLDSALEYLIEESAPRLVAIGGYSGTGKSSLAGALAMRMNGRCGAILLRSDVVRKRLSDQRPEARLSAAYYDDAKSVAVYSRLLKDARRALRAGQAVVLDATFLGA